MNLRRRSVVQIASGIVTLLMISVGSLYMFHVSAAQISSRGVIINNSVVSEAARYEFYFRGKTTGNVGSIRLQICSNDPFPETPCTPPSGFDFTGATYFNEGGMTGFSVDPSSTANEILLTRVPQPGFTGSSFYEFTNVINPDTAGSYYGRIMTYSSNDGTGAAVDSGGLAFDIEPSDFTIQTEVPPYLLFCVGNTIVGQDCSDVTGNYIDFGTFSPTYTATGQTQVFVASNAKYGFIVTVQGTTMTSGVNTIPRLSSPDISRIGTSQFGFNLRANSTPSVGQNPSGLGLSAVVRPNYNLPNYYTFIPGDTIVQAIKPDFAKYTVSYITNVSSSQAPGIYVSTLQYIALATF